MHDAGYRRVYQPNVLALTLYKFGLNKNVCVHRPNKKHIHNRLLPWIPLTAMGNFGTSGQVV